MMFIRSLILTLPKMSGYVNTFTEKGGYKYKYYKLMYLCIDGEKRYQKNIKPFGLRLQILTNI